MGNEEILQFKAGKKVIVDFGYKKVKGVIVSYNKNDKYITVKHDNFAGEVLNINQVQLDRNI